MILIIKTMKAEINVKGIEFDVEFEYQPEEKSTRCDADNSGYPGCAEAITGIYSIMHNGTDFKYFFEDELDMIESKIWESFNK